MRFGSRGGFTLIELLIVVAIILIVAAIAIPTLIRERIHSNEANAVRALKAYADAQTAFRSSRQGRYANNTHSGPDGFADNFRNLHFGNPMPAAGAREEGEPAADAMRVLELIDKAHANAFIAEPGRPGAKPVNGAPGIPASAPVPLNGYLFIEPPELNPATRTDGSGAALPSDFAASFGLVAYPEKASVSGTKGFWIGPQGTVFETRLTPNSTAAENKDRPTPSQGIVTSEWSSH